MVRFGFRMWELLIFNQIFPLDSSSKFQKTKFWKEKSVENVVTLEGLPLNPSTISFHIWFVKKLIHTLQNNVHIWANGTSHTNINYVTSFVDLQGWLCQAKKAHSKKQQTKRGFKNIFYWIFKSKQSFKKKDL